jgi:hypothetical protein
MATRPRLVPAVDVSQSKDKCYRLKHTPGEDEQPLRDRGYRPKPIISEGDELPRNGSWKVTKTLNEPGLEGNASLSISSL